MTTKSKPSTEVRAISSRQFDTNGSDDVWYYNYQTGSNTITYQDGAKVGNKWPWKTCDHRVNSSRQPFCGSFVGDLKWYGSSYIRSYRDQYIAPLATVRLPVADFDPMAFQGILDQLDLNKGESVLLYSGVLQAVPLLGSVAKFTSILNQGARKLAKSFRRKPFTTVVKSMISLDFIDRFVISPTIDDCRKFQAATDYVLNTINTAHERSAAPFALQTGLKTTMQDSSESITVQAERGSTPPIHAVRRNRQYSESKAFALVSARYDVGGLAPVKLWARRVGLTRPLDSMWDLVPFSFVIDYFTRAGDFISRLSDEMSDVEGLRGQIIGIHDLWYTHKLYGASEVEGLRLVGPWEDYNWSAGHLAQPDYHFSPAVAYLKNEKFVRQRIPDPYSYLLGFQEKISDYLTINTTLSSTRKRTIAELIIQAKL